MSGSPILLIIYLLVALVFSYLCSLAEAVLLSVTDVYVKARLRKGQRGARRLADLKQDPQRALAAILTVNTVAHTVGAAGVGHQAALIFGEEWLGITSALLTLMILVASEIIPKTLGTTHWRKLAPTTAVFIVLLVKALLPFVIVLEWISERFGKGGLHGESARHREELSAMTQSALEVGELSDTEARVIENLLKLRRVPIKKIATPRTVVFSLPEATTVQEYRDEHRKTPHSRIPIYGKNEDDITGFVLRVDLLGCRNRSKTLAEFRREAQWVPDSGRVAEMYEKMSNEGTHIAIVANEFGEFAGIVTLEDIMEELLGLEIVDEADQIRDMRGHAERLARSKMKPE